MQRSAIIPILLMMGMFFPAQPSAAAPGAPQPADRALRAWLAPISRLDDPTPATAWNHPLSPVARFYRMVGFRPVWTGPHGLRPWGAVLLRALASASEAGLFPSDYALPDPETIPAQGVFFPDAVPLPELDPYIRLDVVLTDRMLSYAQHLSRGRVSPEAISRQWLARRRPPAGDIPAELAVALAENRLEGYINALPPEGRAYQRLQKALNRYEAIGRSGGWPAIAPGPILHPGDIGPRVQALRVRLEMTGDLPAGIPADHGGYDQAVQKAVQRFQRRHGLAADGLVGRRTRKELNISVEERITRLALNMERRRWFPDNLGSRHLEVNIPAFALNLVEAGTRIHSMRAIVGTNRRKTPVMSGRMTYLEFNPYWNIPQKIARKDILPKIQLDPAYLIRQGIRVFDSWDPQARELDPMAISWKKIPARRFPYRLRQDPSDLNALGRIKFMFPNPQSVYIHDTPGRDLFNRQRRSYSSGCVRVEEPLRLAQYLLGEQGWDRARLEAAFAKGERKTVVLDNPVPVHLVYFTAWVDENGEANFREDLYGWDRQLQRVLEQRTPDLIFCGRDAVSGHLVAACTPDKTGPAPAAGASGIFGAAPVELSGEVAGDQVTGL